VALISSEGELVTAENIRWTTEGKVDGDKTVATLSSWLATPSSAEAPTAPPAWLWPLAGVVAGISVVGGAMLSRRGAAAA
jgi:hypothetical protein